MISAARPKLSALALTPSESNDGFLAAGVPRVLASQWVVDDDATSALMTRFYALWNPKDGSAGLDPCAALRAAQEHVRVQPRCAHPYYWAAWGLWGLPERD